MVTQKLHWYKVPYCKSPRDHLYAAVFHNHVKLEISFDNYGIVETSFVP